MIVTNATPTNDMEQLAVLNLNIALALYNWLLHMTTLIELAVYIYAITWYNTVYDKITYSKNNIACDLLEDTHIDDVKSHQLTFFCFSMPQNIPQDHQ